MPLQSADSQFKMRCPKCGSANYAIERDRRMYAQSDRSFELIFSCRCGKQMFGGQVSEEYDRQLREWETHREERDAENEERDARRTEEDQRRSQLKEAMAFRARYLRQRSLESDDDASDPAAEQERRWRARLEADDDDDLDDDDLDDDDADAAPARSKRSAPSPKPARSLRAALDSSLDDDGLDDGLDDDSLDDDSDAANSRPSKSPAKKRSPAKAASPSKGDASAKEPAPAKAAAPAKVAAATESTDEAPVTKARAAKETEDTSKNNPEKNDSAKISPEKNDTSKNGSAKDNKASAANSAHASAKATADAPAATPGRNLTLRGGDDDWRKRLPTEPGPLEDDWILPNGQIKCTWGPCASASRPNSKYCSRTCSNKNARFRHNLRKTDD